MNNSCSSGCIHFLPSSLPKNTNFNIFSISYFNIFVNSEEGEPKRVIDGLQRLSTIKSYINDEFTLSTLDNIEIDGVPRKLSGKKFSELDPAVKEEISGAEIVLYLYLNQSS